MLTISLSRMNWSPISSSKRFSARQIRGLAIAALALQLAVVPCYAALVTYDASGTITSVSEFDTITQRNTGNYLPAALSSASVGQTINFTFTVDTSTPNQSSTSSTGYYPGAVVSASASIGTSSIALPLAQQYVDIDNNVFQSGTYTTDYFAASGGGPAANYTGITSGFSFFTGAYSSSPLGLYSNTSLSNNPLSISASNNGTHIQVYFHQYVNGVEQGTSQLFAASVASVSEITPVPLPAAAWLMVSGLGGIGAFVRKKRAA